MDGKNIDRLQNDLNISMMFMKAAQEVREQEAEREERIRVRAAEVARHNREEAESKAVYEEYRRINGYTAEERETARREFLETLRECKGTDIK